MEILYSRCCGLDVHAKTVVACLCIEGEKQIRTFSTMTADLLQLADWLLAVLSQILRGGVVRLVGVVIKRPIHRTVRLV